MKNDSIPILTHFLGFTRRHTKHKNAGVALVIVLGMLVLLSVIVLAFLTSVTSDLGDSKGYEAQANARMLADSAVNLVISQIRTASATTSSSTNAWVSQPGLIRTYNSSGNAVAAYKLYSSGTVTVTGSFDPNAGTDLPATANAWVTQPNLWTDINSPVARQITGTTAAGVTGTGSSVMVFPIIDGNGMGSKTLTTTSGSTAWSYTTDGTSQDVQGFYTSIPNTMGSFSGTNSTTALSATNTPVPMPVQWLYMLKDGTLLPATAVAGSKDVQIGDPNNLLKSGTNPIVARIAFWTDDETAKVNINTASEGTFWDTPVCDTQSISGTSPFNLNNIYETDLANNMGDTQEYQRYPGHPATTCLSAVIGTAMKYNLFGSNIPTGSLSPSQRAQFVEAICELTPRVSGSSYVGTGSAVDYSSQGGTRRGGLNPYNPGDNGSYPVAPDTDRLYATTDELVYNMLVGATTSSGKLSRDLQTTISGTNVTQGLQSGTADPRPLIEKTRFFLTVSSKSPETNLFNLPRVAIWPITKPNASTVDSGTDTRKMSTYDKLIAFCATVPGCSGVAGDTANLTTGTSGRAFYFTRVDPKSTTADFSSSGRNSQIYSYLSKMMGTAIPGFGGTFFAKYGTDSKQILTEMFDYVRTTNLVDTSGDTVQPTIGPGYNPQTAGPNGGPTMAYTQPGPVQLNMSSDYSSQTTRGQVVPIVISSGSGSGTRGFGRIATVSEVAIAVQQPSGTATTPTTYAQFVLIPNMYCPEPGFSALANDIRLHFANFQMSAQKSGAGPWVSVFAGGTDAGFSDGYYHDIYNTGRINQQQSDESKIGGPIGIKALLEPWNQEETILNYGTPMDSLWPASEISFSGSYKTTDTISVAGPNGTGNATFDIQISAPAISGSDTQTALSGTQIIQTIHVSFPPFTMPLPSTLSNFNMTTAQKTNCNFGGTDSGGAHGYQQWSRIWTVFGIGSTNTARSVIVAGSGSTGSPLQYDMRTIACMPVIPSTVFQPIGSTPAGNFADGPYFDPACLLAHGTRLSSLNYDQPSQVQLPASSTPEESQNPMQGSFLKGNWVGWSKGMAPSAFSNYTPVSFEAAAPVAIYSCNPINTRPLVPAGINGVFLTDSNNMQQEGDWDNGPHFLSDGSYLNKSDEGTNYHTAQGGGFQGAVPYIGYYWVNEDAAGQPVTFFSPNRMIPSPVVFGSLPTGVLRGRPWQTLLFRPAKPYLPGGTQHPGAAVAAGGGQSPAGGAIPYPPYTTPPDHLLLDLFWMPVVEPYPISEPFATNGKVNMNYQIAPFTYIRRDTGLRAVFQSVDITAIDPNLSTASGGTLGQTYKCMGNVSPAGGGGGGGQGVAVRRSIDADRTLLEMDYRFNGNGAGFTGNQPFRSASEICDIPLVPQPLGGGNYNNVNIPLGDNLVDIDAQLQIFWNCNQSSFGNGAGGNWLTGDNNLERPYSLLYSRLTTRSNNYTVHVRVQTLKKAPTTASNVFKDGQDQVTGEFRGSFLVERYLDPDTAGFMNANSVATPSETEASFGAILGPYKFRVVNSKQFAP